MTWTNKALFDQTGQVAEILAVGSDITKGKMIEETRPAESPAFGHRKHSP